MNSNRQRTSSPPTWSPDSGPTGPVRTCVGCRGRDAKAALVRVALDEGRPALDPAARLPGRGAYLHRHRACVERALRAGKLGRALRTPVDSSHTCALRQSLAALLTPSEPVGQPGERARGQGRRDPSSGAAAPSLSQPSRSRKRTTTIAQRMSSTTIETSPQPFAEIARGHAPDGLTQRPLVDDSRQGRGQR